MIDPEFGEPVELPIGYTAWWTVEGTGGDVTVDTAGSSFDTVLAVYQGARAPRDRIACNDDACGVSNLRSRLTFTSTPNTVYFSKMTGYMVVRTDAEQGNRGTVTVDPPAGWSVTPARQSYTLAEAGSERADAHPWPAPPAS